MKRIKSGAAFSEDDFSTILRDHFIKAFEEADDDIMQIALHRGFSLIFHPDKIKNSEFKYRHYIEEQNWGRIPQQVLNSLSNLKIERPPKFWENPQGWLEFIIFDLYLKIILFHFVGIEKTPALRRLL